MADIVLAELEHCETQLGASRREFTVDRAAAKAVMAAVQAQEAGRAALRQAPFVAYARTSVNGKTSVKLFCRQSVPDHEPATSHCDFVSYLAPMGRLAEQPVGTAITIQVPAGRVQVSVDETNRFSSVKRDRWDAVNNTFASILTGVRSIASLRQLGGEGIPGARETPPHSPRGALATARAGTGLAPLDPDAHRREVEDASRRTIAERDALASAFAAQVRASQGVLQAFELRDQAILDAQQGEVFRRPLSTQLIVTGAPGTGKTTVLIKRIAQKTYREGLTPEEKDGLSPRQIASLLDRDRSWVLFTPSDLLRNYVKEALAKEHLPATQQTVVTWHDKQVRLARDVFRVLRAGSTGSFKRTPLTLVDLSSAESVELFLSAFRDHWIEATKRQLAGHWSAIATLRETLDAVRLDGMERGRSAQPFSELHDAARVMLAQLQNVEQRGGTRPMAVAELGSTARDVVRTAHRALDRFMDDITLEIALQDQDLMVRTTEGESYDAAIKRLNRGLLTGAMAGPASAGDSTAHDPLDSVSSEALRRRVEIARAMHTAFPAADHLTSGYDAVFSGTVAAYKDFRTSLRRTSGPASAFLTEVGRHEDKGALISDQELDVLLYVLLSTVDTIFDRAPNLLWVDKIPGVLGRVRDELRTVVTVDEAADFSWVQLGCMYYLAHPSVRAFAMSGDLMQRVTRRGLRSWEECREFAPELEVHELRLVYRQNRVLLHIAAALYSAAMGEAPPFESPLPVRSEPQPLLTRQVDQRGSADWIAARIVEIYGICDRLPSIGVFVPTEAQVRPVASLLSDALAEHAIDVDGCEQGKVLGTGDRVRVFSIEHIKGLEFHAVFLADFDQLDGWDAELADKYLYVGLTRAAEFLGVTVRHALPAQLESITGQFGSGTWADFGAVETR